MASIRKLQEISASESPAGGKGTDHHHDGSVEEDDMGGMQRSGTLVYSSPDLSVCVYPPDEQKKGNWIDLMEYYQVDRDKDQLLPSDLSRHDIEQGAHGDCFFITACSIVAQHKELIDSLFLSKTWPKEGDPFKFRFWRWDKWQEVHVDSLVPAEKDKKPSYARSPNRRVWPLLLEKAYAAFYGGFDCLEGGNLGETMYALTGKPVETIKIGSQLQTGAGATEAKKTNPHIGAENSPDFWKALAEAMNGAKKPSIMVSVGTCKTLRSKSLQPGHAYAVLDVRQLPASIKPSHGSQVRTVIRLMNPYKAHEYKDAWSKYDKKNFQSGILSVLEKTMSANEFQVVKDGREENNVFWLPVQSAEFMKEFNQINICHLDVNDSDTLTLDNLPKTPNNQVGEHTIRHFPFDISKSKGTAGGNSNWKSWKTNPTLTVENNSGEDVRMWITLAQPEQRTLARKRAEKEGSAEGISYQAVAIEYYTLDNSAGCNSSSSRKGVVDNIPTAFRCSSQRELHRVATYLNQREQSIIVTVSKKHFLGYLTVSCHDPNAEASGLLSVAIPKAVANTCQVHSLKDHTAAYITSSGEKSHDPQPTPAWNCKKPKYVGSVGPDGRCLEVRGIRELNDHYFRLGFDSTALDKWRASSKERLEVHVMYEQEKEDGKRPSQSDTGGDQYWRMKVCSFADPSVELGGFSTYSNYAERALILDVSDIFTNKVDNLGLIVHLEYGKSAPKCSKQHINLKVKIRPDTFVNALHIAAVSAEEIPALQHVPSSSPAPHPPVGVAIKRKAPAGGGGPTRAPAPSMKAAPSQRTGKSSTSSTTNGAARPAGKASPSTSKTGTKPKPKASMQQAHKAIGGIGGLYAGLE